MGDFANAGAGFGGFFDALRTRGLKKDQDAKDQDVLKYLIGEIGGQPLPADIPAQAPVRQAPAAPVEGPQLPPGMAEPDPSVAPAMSAQSGETPYSENYLDKGMGGLLEQKKKAASDLLASPEQTLNLMLEAKRRGAGPGVSNILEFIQGLHKEQFASTESDKKLAASAEKQAKTLELRQKNDEARMRSQERIAQLGADTRLKAAGIGADASRYSADHRGNAHGTPANLDHLDADALYSLMDGYEADLQDLQKPNRSDYDSYDATSLVQFREDYNSYDKARSEMQATIRKIKNAITLKEQGQPNGPGHSAPASPPPAPAPSPAPAPQGASAAPAAASPGSTPGRPSSAWADQQLQRYLQTNGKDFSPKSVQLYRTLLQHNGR